MKGTAQVAGRRVQAPYPTNYYVVARGDFGVTIRGPFATLKQAEMSAALARRDYKETGVKAKVGITRRGPEMNQKLDRG